MTLSNKGQFSSNFTKKTDSKKVIVTKKNDVGYYGGNDNNVYVYRKPSPVHGDYPHHRSGKLWHKNGLWLDYTEPKEPISECVKEQIRLFNQLKREYEKNLKLKQTAIKDSVKIVKNNLFAEMQHKQRMNELYRLQQNF